MFKHKIFMEYFLDYWRW